MSDDDWFERALQEADEQADTDEQAADEEEISDDEEVDDHAESESPADETASAVDETESEFDETETAVDETATEFDDTAPTPDTETPVETDDDTLSAPGSDAGFDAEGDASMPETSADESDDNPFGTDFATALENAPSPDTMGGAPGEGGSSEPGAGFGFGGGGGAPGGQGSPSFDDEDFESDIDRIDVGISGLDEMILGGVPKRSLMVAIGSAGTGKTTFGIQFLHEALKNGGSGVYITLEESRERILDTADEKGWDFSGYEDDGQLSVVAMDPVEMANSLTSIRNDLPRLVEQFGADRLVLDSVSLLEMMYDHPSKRRSEVFDFARSLKNAGVTTMLTSEADRDNPHTSRHGLVEYLADAVFVLQYVRPDDFRETRLAIEIQKIRDANHSRETKPYELTDEGISVYRQANIF
ncbi:KaiC domain-containing protein [Haloferax elongans]|uniref:KaiC domain-containing protein n=1 Tax=Haloferax elongans TaxID=403191 RepID=UPI0006778B1F|nr:KaiC domain-containing protein [Haloferax elongans]